MTGTLLLLRHQVSHMVEVGLEGQVVVRVQKTCANTWSQECRKNAVQKTNCPHGHHYTPGSGTTATGFAKGRGECSYVVSELQFSTSL